MKAISKPALEAVMNEDINFHPAKFKKSLQALDGKHQRLVYQSPALVGHRIPAWYDAEGRFVVANNEAEALEKFYEQYGVDNPVLKQDEDCLLIPGFFLAMAF